MERLLRHSRPESRTGPHANWDDLKMTHEDHDHGRAEARPDRPSRRRFVAAGGAVAGAAWASPSILRVDRAAASAGSCTPQNVAWSGLSGSGPYTATGSSGAVSISATITPMLGGGTSSISVSGGSIIVRMFNHPIGAYYDISMSFSAPGGTICEAATRILDVDQNGRGMGCATVSRFRDEITNLTGTGLSVTPQGGVVQSPPGTWGAFGPTNPTSGTPGNGCKTTNAENLLLNWSAPGGVTGGGFRYQAATPPGTSTTLDLQLIIIEPMSLCVLGAAASAARGPVLSAPSLARSGGVESD